MPKSVNPTRDPAALKETLLGAVAVAGAGTAMVVSGPTLLSAAKVAATVAGYLSPWVLLPAAALGYGAACLGAMTTESARTPQEEKRMAFRGGATGLILGAALGGGAGLLLRTAVHWLL